MDGMKYSLMGLGKARDIISKYGIMTSFGSEQEIIDYVENTVARTIPILDMRDFLIGTKITVWDGRSNYASSMSDLSELWSLPNQKPNLKNGGGLHPTLGTWEEYLSRMREIEVYNGYRIINDGTNGWYIVEISTGDVYSAPRGVMKAIYDAIDKRIGAKAFDVKSFERSIDLATVAWQKISDTYFGGADFPSSNQIMSFHDFKPFIDSMAGDSQYLETLTQMGNSKNQFDKMLEFLEMYKKIETRLLDTIDTNDKLMLHIIPDSFRVMLNIEYPLKDIPLMAKRVLEGTADYDTVSRRITDMARALSEVAMSLRALKDMIQNGRLR